VNTLGLELMALEANVDHPPEDPVAMDTPQIGALQEVGRRVLKSARGLFGFGMFTQSPTIGDQNTPMQM